MKDVNHAVFFEILIM